MYRVVFVGGTFDRLHPGHEAVLRRAFVEGERVMIGLTTDEFVKKFKSQKSKIKSEFKSNKNINSFQERKAELQQWLVKNNFDKRAEIIAINDPYEPAASMPELAALVVTSQNVKTGETINVLRLKNNLAKLKLINVALVNAVDGTPVSSNRIRNGEINSKGDLLMPESLRQQLTKPLGKVLTRQAIGSALDHQQFRSPANFVITVGDIATKTFLDAGFIPSLSIVDQKVSRKKFTETLEKLKTMTIRTVKVKSGPGFISKTARQAIKTILAQIATPATAIIVDGEEDLLTLPAIIYAPLGSIIYYGQPEKGLVEVIVTDEKKQAVQELLTKFV